MATIAKSKRGPTVLVTDSRAPPVRAAPRPLPISRPSTRLISVDNVLQYASEIPSGQRRGPPRSTIPARGPNGKQAADSRLGWSRTAPQHVPVRSSKVSEKLVLLPDVEEEDEDALSGEKAAFEEDEDETEAGPPKDGEVSRRRRSVGLKEKSYAERLPKASRTEKLSRVTAYCTAQAYKMQLTAEFVRTNHGARTKLYDDCLYTVYHLPLLRGDEGYRIRSSPVLKSPGGKAVLDEEIERNERYEYREGYFGDSESHTVGVADEYARHSDVHRGSPQDPGFLNAHGQAPSFTPPILGAIPANSTTFAEMFVFSYGVVVFWNFTERQEKDILADLTFSYEASGGHNIPLVIRPQQESDFETEEFHFEYNPDIARPRVFNDMITLRSGDHMIKLSMSHAIAQSTKLSFFEERMADTMEEAQHVPKRLALTGELGLDREEVVRILGKLFMTRVDVNLSSNVLDVPNFFWDSEPTLHPLYAAVREYLEIKPRIQVLNERCRVFLDLAEILSDAISDRKMSRITWIIIILIMLSIAVTASEVFLRFGLLSTVHGSGKGAAPPAPLVSHVVPLAGMRGIKSGLMREGL